MPSPDRRRSMAGAIVAAAAAVALIGGIAAAILLFERLPDGPVDVAWDRAACAHCRMHVGEPAFAAQLQLKDGQVLNFDDPGCLFRHLRGVDASQIHAVWFHHHREDRWISRERVAFVEASPTPMGYGLGAVDASTPGAVPPDEAARRAAAMGEVRER